MPTTTKVSAKTSSGLVDDHDPNDIAQKSQQEGPAAYAPHDDSEKKGQGIVKDSRGQEQPSDKKRAQQTSSKKGDLQTPKKQGGIGGP